MNIAFQILGDCITEGITCLEKYIDSYARAAILNKKRLSVDDERRDFILFCLTKSVRSLKAAFELILRDYSQDALIILRTVYENYLTNSYTFANPEDIKEVFQKKFGLSIGRYIELRNEKGQLIKGKIQNSSTKEIIDYQPVNIYQLAKGSEFKTDIIIHRYLYKYLSEFIHPNMISSGSYRNEESKMFSIKEDANTYVPIWVSAYLVTILLQQVIRHQKIKKKDLMIFRNIYDENIEILTIFCERTMDLSEEPEFEIFEHIINRLEEEI